MKPSSPVKLVAMLSLYLEGSLAKAALESALEAVEGDWRRVIVFEGPAGPRHPREAELPPTEFPDWAQVHRGAWQTDAEKLTAIVQYVKGKFAAPLWGVWIAGDEILINAPYLLDHLRVLDWTDRVEQGEPVTEPTAGLPLDLIEPDAGVYTCLGRCIRVDLIRRYVVSSSVVEFVNGITMPIGNVPYDAAGFYGPRAEYVAKGAMFSIPPLPGVPFLVHRHHLRHPLRRGLRLHEQEKTELAKHGIVPDGDGG